MEIIQVGEMTVIFTEKHFVVATNERVYGRFPFTKKWVSKFIHALESEPEQVG